MTGHLILLGVLTVTSYRPVPEQTRPECRGRKDCDTAEGDGVTRHGAAASRDLLTRGLSKDPGIQRLGLHYGDVVCIDTFGCRVVNDKMGPKSHQAVDLMVFTKAEERRIGTRHLKVYKLEVER